MASKFLTKCQKCGDMFILTPTDTPQSCFKCTETGEIEDLLAVLNETKEKLCRLGVDDSQIEEQDLINRRSEVFKIMVNHLAAINKFMNEGKK